MKIIDIKVGDFQCTGQFNFNMCVKIVFIVAFIALVSGHEPGNLNSRSNSYNNNGDDLQSPKRSFDMNFKRGDRDEQSGRHGMSSRDHQRINPLRFDAAKGTQDLFKPPQKDDSKQFPIDQSGAKFDSPVPSDLAGPSAQAF